MEFLFVLSNAALEHIQPRAHFEHILADFAERGHLRDERDTEQVMCGQIVTLDRQLTDVHNADQGRSPATESASVEAE